MYLEALKREKKKMGRNVVNFFQEWFFSAFLCAPVLPSVETRFLIRYHFKTLFQRASQGLTRVSRSSYRLPPAVCHLKRLNLQI